MAARLTSSSLRFFAALPSVDSFVLIVSSFMANRSFAALRMTLPLGVNSESRGGFAAPAFTFPDFMIIVILSEVRAKELHAIPLLLLKIKKESI
ncbi:MAG: hypothetical protein EA393_10690 [Bacteroidetes bacterium]|nr:MAG: hypothetical protein EA393_10690 [Bacteroidota bacterium]